MPEQNGQDSQFQNQNTGNGGSDLIREDRGLLNGNTVSEEGDDGKKNKRRFDLLGSTYEDSIWNTNLDGNEKGKDIPKTYPGKKWRNARAIVLIVDVVLSMLGFLTYGLEILSTILMVVFLVLWIKTIRTPENQEIIKERNIGKRLKGIIRLYAIFTVIYIINDIRLVANIEYTIDDVKDSIEPLILEVPDMYDYSKNFTDAEIIKVANEYVGCNCFGTNSTQNTRNSLTRAEYENVVKKVAFNRGVDGALYKLKQDAKLGMVIQRHEDEIRQEFINSANSIMGKNCFGSYTEACDLSNIDVKSFWDKTYMDAISKVAPKIDNGERK